ncbi:MAG: hypothetical protein J6M14_07165 [Campylobacter sp.]|nr:hypothetical protein [Campylobacter sp.]
MKIYAKNNSNNANQVYVGEIVLDRFLYTIKDANGDVREAYSKDDWSIDEVREIALINFELDALLKKKSSIVNKNSTSNELVYIPVIRRL